ncbi:DUF4123 domain-containing protein [Pseudoduganella namucuonensis]|uniref:DUF4123 domain-containing protein n=1 Tax=Pseudoduganella namucuonensis TaxID=1035707 RepID=A0A1I7JU87_9BURK|nr:DUF4123 domain-containing protein [Pseudoduganella namucuonensis]SFU88717.1 protein of unknown function [Pseudoduganella namucuonensis]
MLIDSYNDNWLDHLNTRAARLEHDKRLYLLVDGVFVPGLHRHVAIATPANSPALLFESLPGCSEAARDVSPFVMLYDATAKRLPALLAKCSGWPMVSAIETTESLEELAARLAAWCVVYADGQRFNFRFPDTRRLPGIFSALTPWQQGLLTGPASRWSYIGRNGEWMELSVPAIDSAIAEDSPELDDAQFGRMVGDSEADEVLVQLADRGYVPKRPSRSHAIVSRALLAADAGKLDRELRVDWCAACLADGEPALDAHAKLENWRQTVALES